ncbi:MAG: cephalosporin-C deacetylase [Actinomycetota bacterium]|nr:cephalosporin-C deacetylase [Actinomycetota bacterium]
MAFFDLTGEALRSHRSTSVEPPGFDEFWGRTLERSAAHDLAPAFEPVDTGLRLVETYDVTFAGWDGQPVKAWLTLPAGSGDAAGLPAVVEFVGYGGGRGLAHEPSLYALAGWAHLKMDTRGQGSSWSPGSTADDGADGAPQSPGFMTRGVLDPRTYYYRRVYADAARAVATARAHPAVDPSRVAVTGGSQGGGLTLAAAGLVPDVVAALPDVPFLCDIRRATEITDTMPYGEITRFCAVHRDQVERVLATLDHVDGVHHAARGRAPSLWSVALMDDTCPPSTVYAAYNAYAGPKDIIEYRYNRHEGGQQYQDARKVAFLREIFEGSFSTGTSSH